MGSSSLLSLLLLDPFLDDHFSIQALYALVFLFPFSMLVEPLVRRHALGCCFGEGEIDVLGYEVIRAQRLVI